MNDCNNCWHAVWNRTSNGRLHPDKSGRCSYIWEPPPIPKAFWFSYDRKMPTPTGGFIERNKPHSDCPTFEKI